MRDTLDTSMNPSHDPIPADSHQICILWHPVERSPTDALIGALSKRGLSVTLATSKHAAFAAACSSAKVANRVVVVLDDRDSLDGVDRVLDGLERYGPSVICWEHCVGANPPMIPIVRTPVPKAVVEAVVEPESGSGVSKSSTSASSTLRLVGDNDQTSRPTVTLPKVSKGGQISSSDVLNADELDALLAGEMGQGRRGK